ncbi:MAG: VWA domain-containing protein [Gammaproteobacteria bacterium]|jgi:Ca-activated chloride channel family protein|nr:VWA domain-containing protein [Gammaproteobacteria bacterium]
MPDFAAPLWLAALPLPPLLWYLHHIRRTARAEALIHPLAPLIAGLRPAPVRGLVTPALWVAGCLLLTIALARPQWDDPASAARVPAYDLVIAVDLSGSMRALDYSADGRPLSRLEMVKTSLARFLDRSERLRASLLVFADSAFTYMPATTDRAAAMAMVAELDPSLAGERTALGDAIALAVHRSAAGSDLPRALILLTDGTDTAGDIRPRAAAALARQHGMRIHALGFGREGAVPFPLGNGETIYRELPPDNALLAQLAETSGGTHHHIASPADMDEVLRRIHEVESARAEAPLTRVESYPLLIMLGLGCLLLAEASRRREAAR